MAKKRKKRTLRSASKLSKKRKVARRHTRRKSLKKWGKYAHLNGVLRSEKWVLIHTDDRGDRMVVNKYSDKHLAKKFMRKLQSQHGKHGYSIETR